MKSTKTRLLDRSFPTLVGLTILIGGLAAGVFFLGDGLGVFAPRATPQTTPKQIKITNITDTSFTVSFMTDEVTTGFLKYGTKANQLNNQMSDDRDQLAGNVGTYNTHHITVRSLQPQTTYYFTLGTASNAAFDNNGEPFTVTTHPKLNNLTLAQTVYGTVLTEASTPADGSIVYVNIDGTGELSTLVRSSGTWAVPLSQARTPEGTDQPDIESSTPMTVFVQGKQLSSTATLTTKVGQPQLPVETITLGQNTTANTEPTPLASPISSPTTDESGVGGNLAETDLEPQFTSTPSASLAASPSPSPTPIASPTVQPTIIASAAASPTPTATPTVKPATTPVTLPATNSAQPVSGSFENTLVMLIFGLSFVSFGSFLYLSLSKE